tara:strand:- start:398 stop:667 length:270 start_codon:yes stop_codon:yes gene_type:complete
MAQTVTECLSAGADSVTLIDQVNAGTYEIAPPMTQAEINAMVQRNVDHLEIILAYTATDSTPDIAGAASNLKTTHVAAVTTGTDYIAAH